jgi:cell wall-associated NlpC family hydrolase
MNFGQSRAIAGAGTLMAAPLVLVLVVASSATTTSAAAAAETTSSVSCTSTSSTGGTGSGTSVSSLDAAQMSNAQVIYQVSVDLKLPAQAAVIAIATAMQESTLMNLDYGDRDSLGLFQQRPSQGWGTPAEIMDPVYASTKFYEALEQVPNWQSLPVTVAAQDVQQSGYPDAYEQWQTLASDLVTQFGGTGTECTTTDGDGQGTTTGTTALPAGFTLPAGTPVQVVKALTYALQQLGKPYIYGGDGPQGYDCSGLVMEAYLAAGITLPRTTYQQVDSGTPVYSASELEPGDLIFTMGSDPEGDLPGHVGIYLGSDLVEDAPHTGANIELSKFDGGYWNVSAVAFRRIVG